MAQSVTGAGIICYYDNREGKLNIDYKKDILYLILQSEDGKYDFPKGGIDEGEKVEQCAFRETYEECNLDSFDFEEVSKDYISCGEGLCLFIGKIKEEIMIEPEKTIKIKMNEKTKIFEHKDFFFMTKKEATQNLYKYLVRPLEKADKIIRK